MHARRIVWMISAGLGLGLLQVTFAGHLSILHSQAGLVLCALVLWSFLSENNRLVWYGVIPAGLVLDLFSPLQFGFETVVLCIIALALRQIHQRFIQYATVPIMVISSFLSITVYDLLSITAAQLFGQVPIILILGDGLYTAVLGVVVLTFLATFERIVLHSSVLALRERSRS